MYKNVNSVIDWFIEENTPYYVVFSKDGILSRNVSIKDISTASDALRKTLERLEDDQYSIKYTIYIFNTPQKGKLKKEDAQGLVNLVFEKKSTEKNSDYLPYPVYKALENQSKMLEALQQRLDLMQAVEESEEDEEIEQNSTSNILAGIVNNPMVQNAIAGFITNAVSNMNIFGKNNAPQAIAGIPDENTEEEKIAKAITILYEHDKTLGDDLLKLANIAATKPDQFKMLLSMLRTF